MIGPTAGAPCGYRRPVVADTEDGLLILARSVHDDAVWARRRVGRRISAWRPSGLDDLQSFSVARRDGAWFGIGIDPDLGMVTLSSPDARTWTRDSAPVLSYGETYVMHFGGWTGPDTGFTYGVSDDLELWFLSLAAQVWLGDGGWQAWDSVATRSSAWVAFEVDGSIGWATTSGGTPVDAASRDCTSAP